MIPDDFIWRELSPKEAADELMMLKDGMPRQSTAQNRQLLIRWPVDALASARRRYVPPLRRLPAIRTIIPRPI
jgi:hypothetical protein